MNIDKLIHQDSKFIMIVARHGRFVKKNFTKEGILEWENLLWELI